MALFLAMMISIRERKVMTGWDYVSGIGGAAGALIAAGAMYVSHRAQALGEQAFGESLRDQLHRRIAQLDYAAISSQRTSVLVMGLMGALCPTAIMLLGYRINQKSISDDGYMSVGLMIWFVWLWGAVELLRLHGMRYRLSSCRRIAAVWPDRASS